MAEDKWPALAGDVIEKRLPAELPGWWHEGKSLRRRYDTDGWLSTLALVSAIGYVAEAAGHHPDLEVSWGSLLVKLNTHSARGITERDFALAGKIDAIALWRPEPGSALDGPGTGWIRGRSPAPEA